MALRILSLLFGLAGLALLLNSAYLFFLPSVENEGLVLENPDQVFSDVVLGQIYEIQIRIRNRSGQTRRVIGGGDCPV